MTGYLQRLFDRAAALSQPGQAAQGQPAMRPGSPLARFDQRLGAQDFAADFTFGAGAEPLDDGELPIVEALPAPPIPAPAFSTVPPQETAKPRVENTQDREGTARPSTAARPLSEARPDTDQHSSRAQSAVPDVPAPSRPSSTQEVREIARAADFSHSGLKIAAPAPSARSEPVGPEATARTTPLPGAAIQAETHPVSRTRPETSPAGPLSPPEPDHAVRAVPAPTTSRQATPRVQVEPQQAEPARRGVQPPDLPQPEPFDWREIDQRIAAALDRQQALQDQRAPAREVPVQQERSNRPEQAQRTPVFKTAAESSIIGPIEQSSRPRMLFGERLR